jgi:hypothetical protein
MDSYNLLVLTLETDRISQGRGREDNTTSGDVRVMGGG